MHTERGSFPPEVEKIVHKVSYSPTRNSSPLPCGPAPYHVFQPFRRCPSPLLRVLALYHVSQPSTTCPSPLPRAPALHKISQHLSKCPRLPPGVPPINQCPTSPSMSQDSVSPPPSPVPYIPTLNQISQSRGVPILQQVVPAPTRSSSTPQHISSIRLVSQYPMGCSRPPYDVPTVPMCPSL